MIGEGYVCTLDDVTLKKARDELNEDPAERLGAVQTFRKWIQDQPHLKCPTDTYFLLKFLRQSKFCQLKARQVLTAYLKFKTETPRWTQDLDTQDDRVAAVIKSGFPVPLPGRTPDGCRVLLVRLANLDPDSKLYTADDVMRGFYSYLISLFHEDESLSVNGFKQIVDATGCALKHNMFWGVDNMRNHHRSLQGCYPLRNKGIHFYGLGPVMEAFIAMFKPFLSKKLTQRFHVHTTLESLYKEFPMEILPEEYLPDDYTGPSAGPADTLSDNLLESLRKPQMKAAILEESSSEWGYDKRKAADDEEIQASFRKLSID